MLSQADIQQLRDYVKDPGIGVQNQAESTVRLQVTHSNLKQTKFMEIRLDKHVRPLCKPGGPCCLLVRVVFSLPVGADDG